MKIPILTRQLRHFENHRELKDIPKQPLASPDLLSRRADSYLRMTRHEDNDSRDYDPLPNRILRWTGGKATWANFEISPGEYHVERIDGTCGRRYLHHIHRTSDSLDFFYSYSSRDGNLVMECSHLDYQNPESSFHQRLSTRS